MQVKVGHRRATWPGTSKALCVGAMYITETIYSSSPDGKTAFSVSRLCSSGALQSSNYAAFFYRLQRSEKIPYAPTRGGAGMSFPARPRHVLLLDTDRSNHFAAAVISYSIAVDSRQHVRGRRIQGQAKRVDGTMTTDKTRSCRQSGAPSSLHTSLHDINSYKTNLRRAAKIRRYACPGLKMMSSRRSCATIERGNREL